MVTVLCMLMRLGNSLWFEQRPSISTMGQSCYPFPAEWHLWLLWLTFRFHSLQILLSLSNADNWGFCIVWGFTCIDAINSGTHTHSLSPSLYKVPYVLLNIGYWPWTGPGNFETITVLFHPWAVSGKTRGNSLKKKKQWDEKGPKSAKSQHVWVTDGDCPRPGEESKQKHTTSLWQPCRPARSCWFGVCWRCSAASPFLAWTSVWASHSASWLFSCGTLGKLPVRFPHPGPHLCFWDSSDDHSFSQYGPRICQRKGCEAEVWVVDDYTEAEVCVQHIAAVRVLHLQLSGLSKLRYCTRVVLLTVKFHANYLSFRLQNTMAPVFSKSINCSRKSIS